MMSQSTESVLQSLCYRVCVTESASLPAIAAGASAEGLSGTELHLIRCKGEYSAGTTYHCDELQVDVPVGSCNVLTGSGFCS